MSRYGWVRPLVGLLVGSAVLAGVAPTTSASATAEGRWQLRGAGIGSQAVWIRGDGEPRVSLRCDHGDPVLVMRIAPAQLPPAADQVRLVADGIGMDYPVSHGGDHGLASRIALDAPILDRMLVARRFAISAGGQTLATGSPAEPLSRVVRACRALHWPRDARMEPSDAGFAK